MDRADRQDQPATTRKDRWARFRGLRWWEVVLVVLPLVLVTVGGLLGGLFGAAGLVINLALARRRFGTGAKVALMLAVVVATYVLYFVVAATILAVTG